MSMKRAIIAALIATVVAVALALPLDIERPSDDLKGLIASTDVPDDSDLDVKRVEFKDGNRTALGSNGGCLNPGGSPCACSGIPSNHQYYLTSFTDTDCACGKCNMYGAYFAADKQR
jgi:hypothetical protein